MNIIELETNTRTEHHYHDKVSIKKSRENKYGWMMRNWPEVAEWTQTLFRDALIYKQR